MAAYVYRVTCTLTGDAYIGITSRTVAARWKGHRSYALGKSCWTHLHRAMRKYGIENFSVETVETCESFEAAKRAEIAWIAAERPAYNMTPGGEGRRGPVSETGKANMRGRSWSPEARAAFSEWCKKRGAPLHATQAAALANKGRPMPLEQRQAASRNFKCSEETRAKLAAAQMGRVYSAESRAKMSASAKARSARSRAESTEK